MNKITTKIKQYNRKNIVVSYVFGFFCIIITCILLYNSNRPTDDQSKTPDYSNLGSNPNYGKFSDSVSNNNQNNSTSNTDRDSSQKTYNTQQSLVKINSDNTKTFITESGEVFPLRTYKTLTVNDPSGNQWWTSGTGLNTAWSIGSGSYQTVVAVIDTGFGLKHEEFTNRWATNENEQGVTFNQMPSNLNCSDRVLPLDKSCNLIDDNFDGIVDNETGSTTKENPSKLNCTDLGIELDKSCNLIDDDSNGYIDDVTGWDFANYDANVQAGEINPDGEGTSHGTEVTGILAATGNNNKGIAGIDWSTKILPIQAIDDDSYGNTLTVARAIYYATNRGADIISLSLGT